MALRNLRSSRTTFSRSVLTSRTCGGLSPASSSSSRSSCTSDHSSRHTALIIRRILVQSLAATAVFLENPPPTLFALDLSRRRSCPPCVCSNSTSQSVAILSSKHIASSMRQRIPKSSSVLASPSRQCTSSHPFSSRFTRSSFPCCTSQSSSSTLPIKSLIRSSNALFSSKPSENLRNRSRPFLSLY